MTRLFKTLSSTLSQFFYPSFCLHCNRQTYGKDKWICKACFDQIEWIDTTLACQTCGRPKRDRVSLQCKECRKRPSYLMPFCSCFFPEGPAYSLHEQLRVYESEDVAKIFASLLIVKWKELSWPYPEAVVPIPDSRLEMLSLKRQPNYLVAKALSKILAVPFRPVLTTREKGIAYGFRAKNFFQGNLTDKKVLLVSDMVRDSDTMRFARDAMLSLFPKTIYTLALFDRRM